MQRPTTEFYYRVNYAIFIIEIFHVVRCHNLHASMTFDLPTQPEPINFNAKFE